MSPLGLSRPAGETAGRALQVFGSRDDGNGGPALERLYEYAEDRARAIENASLRGQPGRGRSHQVVGSAGEITRQVRTVRRCGPTWGSVGVHGICMRAGGPQCLVADLDPIMLSPRR